MKKAKIDFSTVFEGNNIIYPNANIFNSKIGFATYVGQNCRIENTHIGKYCSLSNDIKIISATHPVKKFVSTHPAFFSIRKQAGFTYVKDYRFEEIIYLNREKKVSVEIENDVWIGENVKILGGVKIGNGAIIGANALVTKDIEPYSINVGIPSKKIGYRFEEEDIKFLNNFKWWDKQEEWIRKNVDIFENIEKIKRMI